jgi:hypothetical protein
MLRLWVWLADRLINWPIDWLTDLLVSFIRSSPLPAVGGELSGVEVCLTRASEELGPDTDESYALSVPASAGGTAPAAVRAATIFGAMHALESLTQLVDMRVDTGEPTTIPSAPVEIHDKPRFPYRGLMIDSGTQWASWLCVSAYLPRVPACLRACVPAQLLPFPFLFQT